MNFEGQIRKMIAEENQPIRYYLNLKDDFLDVNQLLKRKIHLKHDHNECLGCGLDKPLYRMGYCKDCFFTLPQTNENIIRPELSKAHLGIEQRDLEWEKKNELQPHIVYLSVSSELKVGVTRETQIPTRWIDQGATSAIKLARTDNRYEAGVIEVALKEYVADKTNFRKMLSNEIPEIDLIHEKDRLKEFIPEEMKHFYINDNSISSFEYPVLQYPTNIKSLTLDKEKEFEGVLMGIKGQYWIFEDHTVWNVRGASGTFIKLEV